MESAIPQGQPQCISSVAFMQNNWKKKRDDNGGPCDKMSLEGYRLHQN